MKHNLSVLLALTAASVFTFSPDALAQKAEHSEAKVTKAVAVMNPTKDSKVQGTVIFSKKGNGVLVEVTMSGLTPGKHGFHVHEFGDASSPDGKAAGGHFNPDGHPHAGPDADKRHQGDLGNLEADASGNVKHSFTDKALKLDGAHSIIGRGLVVHEKADDLKSQPSGEAGGRVAVGVIGIAKGD